MRKGIISVSRMILQETVYVMYFLHFKDLHHSRNVCLQPAYSTVITADIVNIGNAPTMKFQWSLGTKIALVAE